MIRSVANTVANGNLAGAIINNELTKGHFNTINNGPEIKSLTNKKTST